MASAASERRSHRRTTVTPRRSTEPAASRKAAKRIISDRIAHRGRWRARSWRATLLQITIGIVVLGCCAVVGLRHVPHALIPLHGTGSFVLDGEYPSRDAGRVHGMRYGSWNHADANTGTLTSDVFRAPAALALMLAGYPSHAGERLELARADDPHVRLKLHVDGDPQEAWETRILTVPVNWRGQRVVFVATDAGRGWGDWLGVADLRPADAGDRLAEAFVSATADVRLRLLTMTVAAMFLVVPVLAAADALLLRLELAPRLLFSLALLLLGMCAQAVFFLTLWKPMAADIGVLAAAAVGTLATLRALRSEPFRRRLASPDAWMPFAVTAACALGYVALFSLAVNFGGDAITADIEHWLGLPVDNVLPHILATRTAAHAPPKPFVGDWLSSDRPPLQAGFDLLFASLVRTGSDDVTRYQALSMVLQTAIFGSLVGLGRVAGASRLRTLGIVVLAWMSGFFFLNSVFVWPKLLAAAFGAAALLVVLDGDTRRTERALLAGIGAGLGLLSHGGIVFTLPVLAITWLWRDRAAAIRPLAIAVAAALVVLAPWDWYGHVYDPPGDRLMKWHLAGEEAVSPDTVSAALVHAYTAVPPAELLHNKLENVATVMGANTAALGRALVPLRQRQFFFVRFALSALLIPYLAALFLLRSRSPLLRCASRCAWIALGANVLWCLMMYGPGTTTVHQGSYLTVLLMYFAGGCVATEWSLVFVCVAAAQASIFAAAWLPMVARGVRLTAGGILDVAVLAALAVAISVGVTPRVLAARASASSSSVPPATVARNRALLADRRDLLILGTVTLAVIVILLVSHYSLALVAI